MAISSLCHVFVWNPKSVYSLLKLCSLYLGLWQICRGSVWSIGALYNLLGALYGPTRNNRNSYKMCTPKKDDKSKNDLIFWHPRAVPWMPERPIKLPGARMCTRKQINGPPGSRSIHENTIMCIPQILPQTSHVYDETCMLVCMYNEAVVYT